MKSNNLLNKIIPPCKECPYKLGQVETFNDPCPECKLNNYGAYETFRSMAVRQKIPSENQQENGQR